VGIWRRLLGTSIALAFVIVAWAAQATGRTDRGFGSGFIEMPVPKLLEPRPVAPSIWDLARNRHGFVGALADLSSTEDVFMVARYRDDGRLDRSFGDGGFTRPLPLYVKTQAQGIAVANGGNIVVAGFSRGRRRTPLLARYLPDGSLDRSFGKNGIVDHRRLEHGGGTPHDVAIQPSGRIVVAGTNSEPRTGVNGRRSGGFVAAYRPDGRVDSSFGEAGRVYFDLPRPGGSYSGVKSIAALSDGRLLVSGFEDGDPFVARLLSDGGLDPSFGDGSGMVKLPILPPSACDDACWSAAPFEVRPDGRIVLVASVFPFAPRLLQLQSDGDLDRGFAHGGIVELPTHKLRFVAFDLGLQLGRIVIAGWDQLKRGDSQLSFSVLRYRANGSLDHGFGRGGRVLRPWGEFSGAFAVLPQSHGRVVVAGGSSRKAVHGYRSFLLLTRYSPG
jgi:uncharacterized delta-60 repeat protein